MQCKCSASVCEKDAQFYRDELIPIKLFYTFIYVCIYITSSLERTEYHKTTDIKL